MFDGVDNIPPAAQLLIEARKLLVEKGWCQNHYAVDIDGNRSLASKEAVRFCASGAIMMCARSGDAQDLACQLLCVTIGVGQENYIPTWNDRPERTKEQVLDAFDRAILIAMEPANV